MGSPSDARSVPCASIAARAVRSASRVSAGIASAAGAPAAAPAPIPSTEHVSAWRSAGAQTRTPAHGATAEAPSSACPASGCSSLPAALCTCSAVSAAAAPTISRARSAAAFALATSLSGVSPNAVSTPAITSSTGLAAATVGVAAAPDSEARSTSRGCPRGGEQAILGRSAAAAPALGRSGAAAPAAPAAAPVPPAGARTGAAASRSRHPPAAFDQRIGNHHPPQARLVLFDGQPVPQRLGMSARRLCRRHLCP
eukprot:scaffold9396_cov100-Isochrysis_galbana.AAC.2